MPAASMDEPVCFEGEFDHHPIFERKGGALEWIAYHEHIHGHHRTAQARDGPTHPVLPVARQAVQVTGGFGSGASCVLT